MKIYSYTMLEQIKEPVATTFSYNHSFNFAYYLSALKRKSLRTS